MFTPLFSLLNSLGFISNSWAVHQCMLTQVYEPLVRHAKMLSLPSPANDLSPYLFFVAISARLLLSFPIFVTVLSLHLCHVCVSIYAYGLKVSLRPCYWCRKQFIMVLNTISKANYVVSSPIGLLSIPVSRFFYCNFERLLNKNLSAMERVV